MIEGLGTVLAGLGLFLSGLRMLSSSLGQISSTSIRGLFKWVDNHFLAIIWGILAGAVSQSAAVLTFIVSTIVSSELINVRSGLSIVGWPGVGTSFLVFLVSFDIKFGVLYLMASADFVPALFEEGREGSSQALCVMLLHILRIVAWDGEVILPDHQTLGTSIALRLLS